MDICQQNIVIICLNCQDRIDWLLNPRTFCFSLMLYHAQNIFKSAISICTLQDVLQRIFCTTICYVFISHITLIYSLLYLQFCPKRIDSWQPVWCSYPRTNPPFGRFLHQGLRTFWQPFGMQRGSPSVESWILLIESFWLSQVGVCWLI